nr:MAG TPA: hypothetical protein [Caudoviricetes sp.]
MRGFWSGFEKIVQTSKFSVDFDKAIVYNLRTTPKIMDLT